MQIGPEFRERMGGRKRVSARSDITAWAVFCRTARLGSIRDAAIELDLGLSTASRHLASLEASLRVPLIDRGKRPLRPTEEGRLLLPEAEAMVSAWRSLLGRAETAAKGIERIRFSLPTNVDRSSLAEHLLLYREIDPGVLVEPRSDSDHEALKSGAVDLALLPYAPRSPGVASIPIGTVYNVMLAAPEYLAERGVPMEPADLARHTLILRYSPNYPVTSRLESGNRAVPLPRDGSAVPCDTATGKTLALLGRGIAVDLSLGICARELESGKLVPVLPEWHRPPWQLTLSFSRAKLGRPKLVRFAEWYAERERKLTFFRWSSLYRRFGRDPEVMALIGKEKGNWRKS